jgi:flagellar biosynthetic protein FliQ
MSIEQCVDILREMVTTSLAVSSPVLIAAVVVGVLMSIVQSVTSIQEPSLSFIPKVTVLGVIMVVSAPWILRLLMNFTISFLSRLPEAAR